MVATIDLLHEQYDDFLKRGQKLVKTPNCAPFLQGLVDKLQQLFKDVSEKSVERLNLLKSEAFSFALKIRLIHLYDLDSSHY